jgi:hypothetical protein
LSEYTWLVLYIDPWVGVGPQQQREAAAGLLVLAQQEAMRRGVERAPSAAVVERLYEYLYVRRSIDNVVKTKSIPVIEANCWELMGCIASREFQQDCRPESYGYLSRCRIPVLQISAAE